MELFLNILWILCIFWLLAPEQVDAQPKSIQDAATIYHTVDLGIEHKAFTESLSFEYVHSPAIATPAPKAEYTSVILSATPHITSGHVSELSVKELKALARKAGIKGFSKMKKAELIERLS